MDLRRYFSERTAIRIVAGFEAFKGAVALLIAAGLVMEQGRLDQLARQLVDSLHLNQFDKYPHLFISAAENVQTHSLWTVVAVVCIYALMRFVESFGLFREAAWAEIFAAVSGAVYIPIELQHVIEGADTINVAALVINLFVVALMLHALWHRRRNRNSTA